MIEELIDKLIDLDISIELVEGDKLKIHTDISRLPGELLSEIRLRKEDLVRYLQVPQTREDFRRIPRAPAAETYPLSGTQRRLWLMAQLDAAGSAYHIPGSYVFDTMPDRDALDFAFNEVIGRHEILRTVFREDATGEPRQFVLPAIQFSIAFCDLRGGEGEEEKLKEHIAAAIATPFDLAAGPLLRATLYQATGRWVFAYVLHHIISDGWSMGLLLQEVMQRYEGRTNGKAHALSPLRIQYKDFAVWQQEQLGDAAADHKAYWLARFAGELPVLELPGDKPRPSVKTYNGGMVRRLIGPGTSTALKRLLQQQDSTLFMGVLAAVNVLLYKYSGQQDIIVGTPIAGREHEDLHDQIGFYTNTLALRTQFDRSDNFEALLQNVRTGALDAYRHQVYPFDELVDALGAGNDRSRNPLFDVMVVVQNNDRPTAAGEGIPAVAEGYGTVERTVTKFDLSFEFFEVGNVISAGIEYNSDIFSQATVLRMADHLEALLAAIVEMPGREIDGLNYLSAAEREEVLVRFNPAGTAYPKDKTLSTLFEEQVGLHPEATALRFENKTVTYSALNVEANQFAHYLRRHYSLAPDERVVVQLERSDRLVVAILAVLKAGAAYVPVDTQYPQERIDYLVQDSQCKALINDEELHRFFREQHDCSTANPDALHTAADLAYIIYTSGSTGQPKGVMIEHGAVCNTVQAHRDLFGLGAGDRSLQFASPSFDAAVTQIFTPLISGGTLCIIGEEEKKDPQALERYITDNNINFADIPPAYQKLLNIDSIRTMERLCSGGEAALPDKVNAFAQTGTYFNAYGPTEASICATMFVLEKGDTVDGGSVPIGKPLANTQVYILDTGMGPVPCGTTGEIHIGGAGLARGYWRNEKLTAEKFVANPFRAGEKVYKTGDLGRWLADGNIEYLGRKDDQVKIRGYRIELGEIETVLQQHAGITGAVVAPRAGGLTEKELVAYIVSPEPQSSQALRAYLSGILPAYMVPAHYVQLDALPVTTNGKIDRKQLPDPEGLALASGTDYVAASTPIEQQLVAIWEEVLRRRPIGVTDDYFELGGSSLKAMMLVKKMVDELGRTLPVKMLFDEKNIRNIARRIHELQAAEMPADTGIREAAAVSPVSANQHVYFSAWRRDGGDHLVINGHEYPHLDVPAFEVAVNRLIARHESLRTVFRNSEGGMLQEVLPAEGLHFSVRGPLPLASVEAFESIREKEYGQSFDLSRFPLFHITVYRHAGGDTVLLALHHIISDGYSGGILQSELAHLYAAVLEGREATLDPLPFQYRDFAGWQARFLQSAEGERHRRYWLNKLAGLDHRLQLPASVAFRKGNLVGATTGIGGALYEAVDRFAREQGLTRTVLFMGTLGLLVHRLGGQEDVTVFTTASGRNSRYYGTMDISGLIGFFVNLLFVRQSVTEGSTVIEHLRRVQDGFLDDLSHDAYPSEVLVRELPGGNGEDFLQSTVFYNYHNYNYLTDSLSDGTGEGREERRAGQPMNIALALGITEFANAFNIQIMFNENLFGAAERQRIRTLYFSLLQQVIADPQQTITSIYKN